jgi:hypothetical protein
MDDRICGYARHGGILTPSGGKGKRGINEGNK